jgi:hypothetical protein
MRYGDTDFQAAMRESGYSAGYYKANGRQIKQDERFRKAYAETLDKSRAKTEDRRERRLRTLDEIIGKPDANDRDIIAAVQGQGRMCGWLSETIRHETTDSTLPSSINLGQASIVLSTECTFLSVTNNYYKPFDRQVPLSCRQVRCFESFPI